MRAVSRISTVPRASAGTRYTNGGITWNASRKGLMPMSARRLRPIATPSTTAITMTSAVAIRVWERVTIESFHRPVIRMTTSHTAVTAVGRQPPST